MNRGDYIEVNDFEIHIKYAAFSKGYLKITPGQPVGIVCSPVRIGRCDGRMSYYAQRRLF